MLSLDSILDEIFDNDEAFQLFCSIAASDESQGGWENGRIAALVPQSERDLAPKIARHGADEDKHGRIFNALLRTRGLLPVDVPADTDSTVRLEHAGIGLAHARLRQEQPLTEQDIVIYLSHSRVTEQRASRADARHLRRYVGSPAGRRPGNPDDFQPTRTTIWPTATRSCCRLAEARRGGCHPQHVNCARPRWPRSPYTAT